MYNLMHGPQGAVASAGSLLLNGALDTKQLYNDDCECYKTGPQAVRMLYAKCETLCRFGQLLHASEVRWRPRGHRASRQLLTAPRPRRLQDIYSHSNWVDYSDPNAPISITNPPGLKQDQPMPWLDLRQPTSAVAVPQDLISGCFWLPPDFDPTSLLSVAAKKLGGYLDGNMGDCVGRVTHDVLNKDKGTIAVAKVRRRHRPTSGPTVAVCWPPPSLPPPVFPCAQGTIVTNSDSTKRSTFATPGGNNFIRAVTVAALDTQDKWAVFQVRTGRTSVATELEATLCD